MESKRKKTSEKKYFDTIKVSEKSTNYVFGESEIDKEQFAKNMEIICQRCNGTGTNPDYKEVNVILAAIDDLERQDKKDSSNSEKPFSSNPHCLSCYGMKKIDWVQYVTMDYKQELMDLKNDMQGPFRFDIDKFTKYIHFGEVWDDGRKKVRFDLERNRWIEVIGYNKNIDSLRTTFKWLHRFKAAGYFDYEEPYGLAFNLQPQYYFEAEEHLESLKTELIISQRVSIERLIEIKNDLDFFFFSIQRLDEIYVTDIVSKVLPDGFKFTWENILKRFDLPLTQLHLFESDENKSVI